MLNKDSLLFDNHLQPTPTLIIVLCVSSCHKFNSSNSLDTHGAKLCYSTDIRLLRANQQTQVHAHIYATNKLKEKKRTSKNSDYGYEHKHNY